MKKMVNKLAVFIFIVVFLLNINLIFANHLLDPDHDLISRGTDNCPEVYNPNQADSDNDITGNACDSGNFKGIPAGFNPVVAYYHDILSGRTSLFDSNAVLYTSDNGIDFSIYIAPTDDPKGKVIQIIQIFQILLIQQLDIIHPMPEI